MAPATSAPAQEAHPSVLPGHQEAAAAAAVPPLADGAPSHKTTSPKTPSEILQPLLATTQRLETRKRAPFR